jgi:hypothetical protein
MRTLVVGIPLPSATFDNYSFASAPSFADYSQIIVDMESVSQVVDEIAAGVGEHKNFVGHPVTLAPTTPTTFRLADLLAMRSREAGWSLTHGSVIVCLAQPDVAHTAISGVDGWRRYSWLPSPEGFRYAEHLLPGYGTPGAVLTEEDHIFAPYVRTFGERLSYRTVIDDNSPGFADFGRVFIRSTGGLPIGAELHVQKGSVIILPPLSHFESERALLAQTLSDCLERHSKEAPDASSPLKEGA